MDKPDGSRVPPDGTSSGNTDNSGEFAVAMERLEKAVQEIVTVTTGQFSERATGLINETSKRLEMELRLRRVAENEAAEEHREQRRKARGSRHRLADRAEKVNPRSGRLYRDPSNEKIGGVCAGLARYLSVETWMVRCGALAGLFMLPGIVFPAYWIAYFVMDTPPQDLMAKASETKTGKRARRRARREDYAEPQREISDRPFTASKSLRHANADLTEAELRLRRLESFVTSEQNELQRELARIESEGEAAGRV